jgi:4-hydroxybenzoate polyprenyltransferase
MVGLLLWLWSLSGLGWVGLAGVAVTAALLTWEHSLVSADDFSKVDAAFFQVNGIVGVLFFVFWATDMGLGGF